jgi:hypothetical protein
MQERMVYYHFLAIQGRDSQREDGLHFGKCFFFFFSFEVGIYDIFMSDPDAQKR